MLSVKDLKIPVEEDAVVLPFSDYEKLYNDYTNDDTEYNRIKCKCSDLANCPNLFISRDATQPSVKDGTVGPMALLILKKTLLIIVM